MSSIPHLRFLERYIFIFLYMLSVSLRAQNINTIIVDEEANGQNLLDSNGNTTNLKPEWWRQ